MHQSLSEQSLKDKIKIALAIKVKGAMVGGYQADIDALRNGTSPHTQKAIEYINNAIKANGDPNLTTKLIVKLANKAIEEIKADKNKINDINALPKMENDVRLALYGHLNKAYLDGSDGSDGKGLGTTTNALVTKIIKTHAEPESLITKHVMGKTTADTDL